MYGKPKYHLTELFIQLIFFTAYKAKEIEEAISFLESPEVSIINVALCHSLLTEQFH